jgi:outer membrane immunogenic protein
MKRLSLGSIVLVLLGALSPAAAEGVAKRTAAAFNALAAPTYNWTGFYIGVNLGGSFGNSSTSYTIAGVPFGGTTERMDGVLGGLQAGYNWQTGRTVFGFETDLQATSQSGVSSLVDFIPGTPGTPGVPCIFSDGPGTPCRPGTGIPGVPGIPAVTGIITYQNQLPWFGTFRGRIGYTPAERWLVYATGGLAYGEVRTIETLTASGTSLAFSSSALRLGWTLGGGIETVIAKGWTARFEYLYIDFGTVTDLFIGIAPITPIGAQSHVTDNIVRISANYHFGSP